MPIEDVTLGEVYRLVSALGQTVDRLATSVSDLRASVTREVQELVTAQAAAQATEMARVREQIQGAAKASELAKLREELEELDGRTSDIDLIRKLVYGAVGVILLAVVGALVALVVQSS